MCYVVVLCVIMAVCIVFAYYALQKSASAYWKGGLYYSVSGCIVTNVTKKSALTIVYRLFFCLIYYYIFK